METNSLEHQILHSYFLNNDNVGKTLILHVNWKGSQEAYNYSEDTHKIIQLSGQLQSHKY